MSIKRRNRPSLTPPAVLAEYAQRASNRTGHLAFGRTQPLSRDQITQIRELWQTRQASQVELAVRFQTSQTTISKICRRRFWSRNDPASLLELKPEP
jgi:hypothetical protein